MKDQQIVAIYCRLSKEDLDKKGRDESESIQNQKLMLMDYAVSNGLLIHNVYVDEDMSGFSDRLAFKRMLRDAANGQFNIVLCKHQSRFTRDMELVEKYIHGLFPEWGIRFISLTDNVDTDIKGNKKARQIYGLINEWYSEDLSNNIRTVFRKKMEAGQYLGAFAAYGYMKDPNDRHKIIVDETAAAVVREIYNMYLGGYGTFKIATTLTERGVPTPTQHKRNMGLNFQSPNTYKHSEKHGVWASSTIKKILQNQIYIGVLIQGRERKVSYKTKKTVLTHEDDWVVIENNHEPLVDRAMFRKVQKILESNRRVYREKNNLYSRTHLFAGKIKCADCGSTMERAGATRDGKTHYIRCKLASRTRGRDCTPHRTKLELLEAGVLMSIQDLLGEIQLSINEQKDAEKILSKHLDGNDQGEKVKKQLLDIEAKLEAVQKKLVTSYSDKIDGLISESDFILFRTAFDGEKCSLERKMRQLEQNLKDMHHRKENSKNIGVLLNKYATITVLTHEIVNDFIEVIEISESDEQTNKQVVHISWLF